MGKIRIKTLGIEEIEKEEAHEAKRRKEAKKAKKTARAPGLKGGERVVSMAPTEEELEKLTMDQTTDYSLQTTFSDRKRQALLTAVDGSQNAADKQTDSSRSTVDQKKKAPRAQKKRSKRYRDALIQVDRNKNYSLSEAIELLKKLDSTRFDATVELHINTAEKGINAQVTLPYGTGKVVRVAIANPATDGQFDNLISQIEQGKIDFDVLIAHPSAMPKLAKVAKILGPKGLMPNPKSGTISDKPKELAEKFKGGQLNFRSESQAPIIHAAVGKVSFKEEDLSENIVEFLKAVGVGKIRSVTLKSTMSPGIKLDLSSFS